MTTDNATTLAVRMDRIRQIESLGQAEFKESLRKAVDALAVNRIKPDLPAGIRLSGLEARLKGETLASLTLEKVQSACKVQALAGCASVSKRYENILKVGATAQSDLINATDSDKDLVAVSIMRHQSAGPISSDELMEAVSVCEKEQQRRAK